MRLNPHTVPEPVAIQVGHNMKKTQRSIGLTPLDSLLVFVPIAIALRWRIAFYFLPH